MWTENIDEVYVQWQASSPAFSPWFLVLGSCSLTPQSTDYGHTNFSLGAELIVCLIYHYISEKETNFTFILFTPLVEL